MSISTNHQYYPSQPSHTPSLHHNYQLLFVSEILYPAYKKYLNFRLEISSRDKNLNPTILYIKNVDPRKCKITNLVDNKFPDNQLLIYLPSTLIFKFIILLRKQNLKWIHSYS